MAGGPEISKQDTERARKALEPERPIPPYRKPSALGSYLLLVIALAIAGVIVYFSITHRQQFAQFWQRVTHPDSVPAQTYPGR